MKNKLLKLCKRLNKVAIEEITPILQATRGEICPVLEELVIEGRLNLREDGVYFYKEKQTKKQELPLFFEFRTKEELDLIIRCFCADLPCTKTAQILDLSNGIIEKFNQFFRKQIYENQFAELSNLYFLQPQTPRIRKFFDIPVYFYFYDNRTFVSGEALKTNLTPKTLAKSEDLKFRKTYLKLTRRINHHSMISFLSYYIAEEIWRIDKDFEELYENINRLH
ncbi:MAG: hypothetical protein PHV37_07375 [Candidatus Gastranaerophilales bacterium]|nr:hypothetical protein [Candidatus Gastranaerophilales bacterium]